MILAELAAGSFSFGLSYTIYSQISVEAGSKIERPIDSARSRRQYICRMHMLEL